MICQNCKKEKTCQVKGYRLFCDDCFIDLKRTISEMWTSV